MTAIHIAKPIGALEADASRTDRNLHMTVAESSETGDQALRRLGILDAKNVLVVVST